MTPRPDELRDLNYAQVVSRAVENLSRYGYDTPERVDFWAEQIRLAAERGFTSEAEVENAVRGALGAVMGRATGPGALSRVPGVTPFTLQHVQPQLRAELERRIAANVALIKLNRPQSVAKTQQRFRGWATSVPSGGSKDVPRRKVALELRKPLASLSFEERRCTIDQSAKLFSAVNSTIAEAGGAIGAFWHSHKNQRGYDGRPAHNARDGRFFLLKDSWAHEAGLVKPGKNGYTTDVEQPAELPYCKCSWQFVFSLRSVPDECVTARGRAALAEARGRIANAA